MNKKLKALAGNLKPEETFSYSILVKYSDGKDPLYKLFFSPDTIDDAAVFFEEILIGSVKSENVTSIIIQAFANKKNIYKKRIVISLK